MKTLVFIAFLAVGLFAAPSFNSSNGNCYKSRILMNDINSTFDALKETLMNSNMNIVTVSKKDGVLTAKGNQYNEDTVSEIVVSISFKSIKKSSTKVNAIASYTTREKKSEIGQIGAGGVTLPIPVPLSGRYVATGSGNIDDSLWYQGFFTSLEKILFDNEMKKLD
jgi:hypothetical protein